MTRKYLRSCANSAHLLHDLVRALGQVRVRRVQVPHLEAVRLEPPEHRVAEAVPGGLRTRGQLTTRRRGGSICSLPACLRKNAFSSKMHLSAPICFFLSTVTRMRAFEENAIFDIDICSPLTCVFCKKKCVFSPPKKSLLC